MGKTTQSIDKNDKLIQAILNSLCHISSSALQVNYCVSLPVYIHVFNISFNQENKFLLSCPVTTITINGLSLFFGKKQEEGLQVFSFIIE